MFIMFQERQAEFVEGVSIILRMTYKPDIYS